MKKLNFAFSIALACASMVAVAGQPAQLTVVHGDVSSVVVHGQTSSSATGGDVAAWGRTTVDGTHNAVNGSTHFTMDVGAQGVGQDQANAKTSASFGEVRHNTSSGPQCGSGGMYCPQPAPSTLAKIGNTPSTSSVQNAGSMRSSATGTDPQSAAWGYASNNGNLPGPNNSAMDFTQEHGYDVSGASNVAGHSQGSFGATYSTRMRVGHP